MADLAARWRALRLAVKQAHALGTVFRICGADIAIDGFEQLPDKLRDALDRELLREYFGASEDDEEAAEFLEELGVEAAPVTNHKAAIDAVAELEAAKAPFLGVDIETLTKPEYAIKTPIKVNVDGSIGKPPKDKKKRRHPATDPNQADIATLQLYAGGKRCFV